MRENIEPPLDYYERLDLSHRADAPEIERAAFEIQSQIIFEELDASAPSISLREIEAKADQRFRPYQEAYLVLSDPEKREAYDQKLQRHLSHLRDQALVFFEQDKQRAIAAGSSKELANLADAQRALADANNLWNYLNLDQSQLAREARRLRTERQALEVKQSSSSQQKKRKM